MEQTVERWPDLFFGPINLWSAPWLGRPYHNVERQTPLFGAYTPENDREAFIPLDGKSVTVVSQAEEIVSRRNRG